MIPVCNLQGWKRRAVPVARVGNRQRAVPRWRVVEELDWTTHAAREGPGGPGKPIRRRVGWARATEETGALVHAAAHAQLWGQKQSSSMQGRHQSDAIPSRPGSPDERDQRLLHRASSACLSHLSMRCLWFPTALACSPDRIRSSLSRSVRRAWLIDGRAGCPVKPRSVRR